MKIFTLLQERPHESGLKKDSGIYSKRHRDNLGNWPDLKSYYGAQNPITAIHYNKGNFPSEYDEACITAVSEIREMLEPKNKQAKRQLYIYIWSISVMANGH